VPEIGGGSKCRAQLIERRLYFIHPFELPILQKEGSDGSRKFAEILDKLPVEVAEAEEHVNVC